MSRRRTAVALAAAAASFLIAPHVSPAAARPVADGPVQIALGAAAHEPPLIEGVVADQFGRFVDDVEVVATRGSRQVPAASALTYASDTDGGPQHGYFFLEVGRKGKFTVTLSKPGYRTVVLEQVRIRRTGQTVDLGEVEVPKLFATTTEASAHKRTVTTRQHGEADVTVRTKATKRPTGDLEVREGGRVVGEGSLRGSDRGDLTIELDRLPKGSHRLRAYFLGTDELKPSASATFTLVVTRSRH